MKQGFSEVPCTACCYQAKHAATNARLTLQKGKVRCKAKKGDAPHREEGRLCHFESKLSMGGICSLSNETQSIEATAPPLSEAAPGLAMALSYCRGVCCPWGYSLCQHGPSVVTMQCFPPASTHHTGQLQCYPAQRFASG